MCVYMCVCVCVCVCTCVCVCHVTQVTVHLKGETECFDCHPKPVPKSFPICTLRNTPDKPIHCIVWAKDLLFTRLFGKQDQVTGTVTNTQTRHGNTAQGIRKATRALVGALHVFATDSG